MASGQAEVWTIGKLLSWTTAYLQRHGSDTARLDAEVLLAHCVGCDRIDLYTRYDQEAGEPVRAAFRELVRQRAAGKPVAYLVGRKEFFSLLFEVTPAVMIPRPDSEFVVLEFLRCFRDVPDPIAVDVGTGSGNLAIAAATQHPGAKFYAIDISPEAIEVAKRNATRHNVEQRIEFIVGDLLEPLPTGIDYDCIMSNPPYVPSGQIERLPAGVRDCEPHVALDGGPTGLEVAKRLVNQAAQRLRPGGQLIIEIGTEQELPVRETIEQQGLFELLPTIHDYASHPRVVSATRKL